ncbi:MAG: sigma-70 family RNA polymerase sigma factor [Bdellovibrionales bacterium]|nr:sigma-70 family RNA polymerase sigma factor [Bdellovibrionales bacterium]
MALHPSSLKDRRTSLAFGCAQRSPRDLEPLLNFSFNLKVLQTKNLSLFNATYTQYSKLLYGISLHILFNSEEAEDVVQECFIAFAEEMDKIENPKFWLVRAATNKSIDRYRRKKVVQGHADKEIASDDQAPFFTISTQLALSKELRTILASLKEQERALLILKLGYDYQYDELSSLLGVPEGSLKSQVSRLLKKIQSIHGAHHEG